MLHCHASAGLGRCPFTPPPPSLAVSQTLCTPTASSLLPALLQAGQGAGDQLALSNIYVGAWHASRSEGGARHAALSPLPHPHLATTDSAHQTNGPHVIVPWHDTGLLPASGLKHNMYVGLYCSSARFPGTAGDSLPTPASHNCPKPTATKNLSLNAHEQC